MQGLSGAHGVYERRRRNMQRLVTKDLKLFSCRRATLFNQARRLRPGATFGTGQLQLRPAR